MTTGAEPACAVEAVPEDAAAVEAWDRELRRDPKRALAAAAEVKARYAAEKVTTLDGIGWPLRPLFLPRSALEAQARAFHASLDRLRMALLEHVDDAAWLEANVALPTELFTALDLAGGLAADDLLAIMRPDGFPLPDRFLLTEVNFGNGTLVSNAYSDVLFDLFRGIGIAKDALPAGDAGFERPFPKLIELLRSRLPTPTEPGRRPFVALLAHAWEHEVILGWEERVIQQFYFAQRRLREAGLDNEIVHEDDLRVAADGRVTLASGQPVDLVHLITIGTSFMDEPARLAPGGDLAHLRGASVGDLPFVKPLASLLFDKGTMPLLRDLWAEADPALEVAPTWYPERGDAVSYRTERERFVLKRAFDGKDTLVGPSAKGRRWNRTLERALASKLYVMQNYHPLPRTTLPVSFDGETIAWIPVRVELSPFVIEGRFGGAVARYAPDAEGLILSPPPPDMGMTLVYAT